MIPNLLPALWWTWLLYLVLALAYLAALAASGWSSQDTLAAVALALGALGMSLALRPRHLLRLLQHRLRRVYDLSQPLELHTWPGQIRTFLLSDKLALRPDSGELLLRGGLSSKALPGLDKIKLLSLEEESQHWRLSLWEQAQPGPEQAPAQRFALRPHPVCEPMLYWALWRLCQRRGWGLRAPFGGQRAEQLTEPLAQRLEQQHRWANQDLQELRGEIPFLEEDSPQQARYRFPMHSARPGFQSALRSWATAQHRWMTLLAAHSLLGLVTAPLLGPILWLRARLSDRCELELLIKDGHIHLGGSAEPVQDILYLSLLPVHPGAPVLLTRNRAVLLGGLEGYEDRVRCGRHLLGRLLRELPQQGQATTPRRQLTRPGAVSAFLGPRWSWRPDEPRQPERGALLLVLLLGTLGWALYGWQPMSSAFRLFGALPWDALPAQGHLWGAALLGWLNLWLLWRWWRPQEESKLGLLKGPVVAVAMVAAVGVVAMALLPYHHQGVRTLSLRGLQAPGAKLAQADLRSFHLAHADLRGADLRGADLSGADLFGVDFQGADLRGARLLGAIAQHANFREARLRGADLREAQLSYASLESADLQEARLNKARLFQADLSGAKLRGAELHHAQLLQTRLSNADLTAASFLLAQHHDLGLNELVTCEDGRPWGQRSPQACLGLEPSGQEVPCLDGQPQGARSRLECLLGPSAAPQPLRREDP